MENKKSKEDIQFEKDMEIIKKGGRTATYEELDFSKSGNPLPKKTLKMEKKKSERDIQFEKEMAIIKKGGRVGGYEELDFSKSGNPLPAYSSDSAIHSGDIVFFVTFGDYIYIKPTFLSITTFSIKFPVNIRPGSWSFLFSLLITKYEISPKVTKNLKLTTQSGLN